MDPVTAAKLITALIQVSDVVWTIGTYYMRRVESQEELDQLVAAIDEMQAINKGLKDGTMTPEDVARRTSALLAISLKPMRDAIARL